MEYIIITMISVITLAVVAYILKVNIQKIKNIGQNSKLDEITKKYPDNNQICIDILKILKNENVKIEENNEIKASLYIAVSNKILIANIKESYTRIQTIAHECLHSVQDRRILMFNFIFSNIFLLYFFLILILEIFKVLPNKIVFLLILILMGFVQYVIRAFLENDAMIKAKYLSKEYMDNINISSKEEIENIIEEYKKLNDIGIKCVNYKLFFDIMIKIIIFSFICYIV